MNIEQELLLRARQTIEVLMSIIDDIDSTSDLAKDDDRLYRIHVENFLKDRWSKTDLKTDGWFWTSGIISDIQKYIKEIK